MQELRQVYAQKALAQLPRLLGNMDRNRFSPTYGCCHRDYWLDKTSDFPDAVRQFQVHALAQVYRLPFPGNRYQGQPKVRDWAIAALDYWARLQHADGSFDEFYPYERGWVGPTAFTTFTSIEAYHLLQDELPDDVAARVRAAVRKAALFICAGESEEDHLANHHAMACLAVWKAYRLLDDPALKEGYQQVWKTFLTYHHPEGWSREYDGVDPGYLSATVSFLGKIYQENHDPAILDVLRQSVEFCSYFAYPNGYYAGSMGSRNTLHLYPHGFEILADTIPMAGAVAEKMLLALSQEKLVPPEIISDRYVVYRVPEFLQAFTDYTSRADVLPLLPYEREPFTRYFPGARIYVATRPEHYIVANLAKGGVVKVFDRASGALRLNDCGILGESVDGQVVTSQWIDPEYTCDANERGFEVRGNLNAVPSHKLFNLKKNLLFRSALLALGWSPAFSHMLKGSIRKVLMLGRRPVPVQFTRRLQFNDSGVMLTTRITSDGTLLLTRLSVGDEFFVRYVPQSRYFQPQELDVCGHDLSDSQVHALNECNPIIVQQGVSANGMPTDTKAEVPAPYPVPAVRVQWSSETDPQTAYWEGQRARRDPTDPVIAAFAQPKIDFIAQHVALPPGARIFDVGCGNGYFTHYLQQLAPTVGLDYARAMLAMHPGERLIQGSALDLPVADNSFAMVFCSNLLHHIANPVAALREMRRISTRYVVVHEPNRANPAMLALGLLKREERLSLRYTQGFVREQVERAGLRVLACATLGFVTPNRMPRQIIDRLAAMNTPNPLAAFHVVVAEVC